MNKSRIIFYIFSCVAVYCFSRLARSLLFIYILFACPTYLTSTPYRRILPTSFLLSFRWLSTYIFHPPSTSVTEFWSCAAHNCIQSSAKPTPNQRPHDFPSNPPYWVYWVARQMTIKAVTHTPCWPGGKLLM